MHITVLKEEAVKQLAVCENENFIDATYGHGGHSREILKKNGPDGKILAIEADPEIFKNELPKKPPRVLLVNDSYLNLEKIVDENNFRNVKGIIFDLGISSWHIENSGRGFSFRKDEILDMRFRPNETELTAAEIINSWPKEKIAEILKNYGEERFAIQISKLIAEKRKKEKILTSQQLVETIRAAVPNFYKRKKIHFATKTFQALRIAVNGELEAIKSALPEAINILPKNGRIVVISFHSLEDRIVKNFFREKEKEGILKRANKKPINPSFEEIKNNPRARSAKLRAAIKL